MVSDHAGRLFKNNRDIVALRGCFGAAEEDTWQAAHLLALAQTATGEMEQAVSAARLATNTLDQIVSRLPDAALRRTFLAWNRANSAREDMERLLRQGWSG